MERQAVEHHRDHVDDIVIVLALACDRPSRPRRARGSPRAASPPHSASRLRKTGSNSALLKKTKYALMKSRCCSISARVPSPSASMASAGTAFPWWREGLKLKREVFERQQRNFVDRAKMVEQRCLADPHLARQRRGREPVGSGTAEDAHAASMMATRVSGTEAFSVLRTATRSPKVPTDRSVRSSRQRRRHAAHGCKVLEGVRCHDHVNRRVS